MDGKENKDLLTSTNFTFYFSDEMSSFIKNNLIQKKKKKKIFLGEFIHERE